MKITLTVNDIVIRATMIDNATSRDFVSLLPLTLDMNDLFGREKYAHLPRPISRGGGGQATYEVGDVAYWPPGPDLVVFYSHDGQRIPGDGVVLMGSIDSGIEVFEKYEGAVEVTVTVAD